MLSATAARFAEGDARTSPLEGALAAGLRLTPPAVRRGVSQTMLRHATRDSSVPPAVLDEIRGHDPAALVEAMRALGRFDARPWLAELRCPAVSVITARDRLVPPSRQLELAAATGARVVRIDADHLGAVGDRARFLPALTWACRYVASSVDMGATG